MSFLLPSSSNAATMMSLGGNVVQGIGQIMQGRSEQKLGDYNAQIYEQNATAQRESQKLLEFQKRKSVKTQISSQVANYAKSGVAFTGSPIEVVLDSLSNAELDIAVDKYNSEVAARGYESKAAVTRYEAGQKAGYSYAQASKTFLTTAASLFNTQSDKIGGAKSQSQILGYDTRRYR